MSSIQSFLRQRNVANTIFQAPTNDCYYNFIADNGNYVGNYPPGHMELASASVAEGAAGSLIRDMGKTIKAPLGTLSSATSGFFREVQLITPVVASTSSSFGVQGGAAGPNSGNAGYDTYYIPIIVDGTIATSNGTLAGKAELPTNYIPFGGQM
jgi:hypothetical protein